MVGTESDKQPTIERNALIHIDTPASPPRTSAFPDWGAAGDPRRSPTIRTSRGSAQQPWFPVPRLWIVVDQQSGAPCRIMTDASLRRSRKGRARKPSDSNQSLFTEASALKRLLS